MPDIKCAVCGTVDDTVAYYSPDMDIKPVPLCILCLWNILGTGGLEAGSNDH